MRANGLKPKMNDPLQEAKAVLNDLEDELGKAKAIWDNLRVLNPGFEQLSEKHWMEKSSRNWLHGATAIPEAIELEQRIFDSPPISQIAQLPASRIHRAWKRWLEKKGEWGAYYCDAAEFRIPLPKQGETLIDFIMRLAHLVEESGKGDRLGWRALKSFLDFVRKKHPVEEVAFIEHIFPKKMRVFHSRIIRLISPETYPIPEETAANILIELARRCRTGRPDTQLMAAECLGLCWVCLTASRLRLPVHLEVVQKIKPIALQSGPILQVPTWFGDRPVKISHRIAKFLNALADLPSKTPRKTILQRPLRSLNRAFENILQTVSPNPEYGNITIASLLSQPHIFGDHRYQPNELKFK